MLRRVLLMSLIAAGSVVSIADTSSAAAATETSAGSTGNGRLGPTQVVDLSRVRALSPQGLLPAPSSGAQTESVIDSDDRERILVTRSWPARTTVLITFKYFGIDARCSGWMAGPSKVVTAGHCVAPGSGGSYFPVSGYRVYPAAQGGDFKRVVAPFGSCGATRLDASASWRLRGTQSGGDIYDVGVITLDCNVGTRTGWLGFASVPSANGLGVQVMGYPGDKWFTLWRSTDQVRASDSRRLFYAADTVGGMSGSPVLATVPKCNGCVVAIHAYGVYGTGVTARYNHGTRIDPVTFRLLKGWLSS